MWALLLTLWIPMQAASTSCPDPNAANSLKGDLIVFQAHGTGTDIVVNRGTKDGLGQGWGGWLLDGQGNKRASFCLRSINSKVSSGFLMLPFKDVKAGPSTSVLLVGP